MGTRTLPDWCITARKAMLDKRINITEMAESLGYTRSYVSAILCGRSYSAPAVKTISDYLNISDSGGEPTTNFQNPL